MRDVQQRAGARQSCSRGYIASPDRAVGAATGTEWHDRRVRDIAVHLQVGVPSSYPGRNIVHNVDRKYNSCAPFEKREASWRRVRVPRRRWWRCRDLELAHHGSPGEYDLVFQLRCQRTSDTVRSPSRTCQCSG